VSQDLLQLEQLLVAEGIITEAQLEKARARQAATGHTIGRVLIEIGALSEGDLLSVLASQIGMEYVDLSNYRIDPSAAALIPETVARRYQAIPIGFDDDGTVVVAMSDPANVIALDDIRTVTNRDVRPVVATKNDILDAVGKVARADSNVAEIADLAADASDEAEDLSALTEAVEDAPIVKLVNMLITQAVQDRASDIHIEPAEKDIRIRYRIDGVLHEVMRTQKSVQSGLISRLKIMADINIAERRIPQDGRVSMSVMGKPIDLRVATLPTVYGEKVVLRILDKTAGLVQLSELGFSEDNLHRYEDCFRQPYGCILVCGPTGSGKSTTLYSTLSVINDPDRNIITVEDPVEYRLAGVNQVQVNNKAGLTFAAALRSILRSDPDVVLVGEVRDKETAQIAVEAALTGHLVLTTLHTNDAPSAMTRLPEMGVETFLVASAVDCVLAQRLARRLCSKCKEAHQPTEQTFLDAKWPFELEGSDLPVIYRAVGCAACSHTGYRGRIALHEVMKISEEIERLTVEHRSSEEIKKQASLEGMRILRDDGFLKVRDGVTSLEEIVRVVV
jgi:type IV pilus assembly protein PilB